MPCKPQTCRAFLCTHRRGLLRCVHRFLPGLQKLLALKEYGILYHRIRIAAPRHNGKVERQHRIDQERFYSKLRMYSLEDGRKQLKVYQQRSNSHIKLCLGLRSPNEVLADYLSVM